MSFVIVVAVTQSCIHTAICICHKLVDTDRLLCGSCTVLCCMQDPETWPEVYGYDSFDHVYLYSLFLGQDARGNMLPVRQLRDRYSQQRQDVYPKEDVSNDDDADKSSPD